MSTLFLLTIISMIIVNSSPATSYETSHFSATPLSFWIIIFIIVLFAIIFTIIGAYSNLFILRILPILLLTINFMILFNLNRIRNYYVSNMNGDGAFHYRDIQYINNVGSLSNNQYPIIHIFSNQFMSVLNFDIITTFSIIPLLFAIVGILLIFLFTYKIYNNHKVALWSAVLTLLLVSHLSTFFAPNNFANTFFLFFIVVLFNFYNKYNLENSVLLIVAGIALILYHPVPYVVGMVSGLALFLIKFRMDGSKKYFNILLIFIVIFLYWTVSAQFLFQRVIRSWMIVITTSAKGSGLNQISQVEYATSLGYNPIQYFLIDHFVLLIFMSLVAMYILNKKRNGTVDLVTKNICFILLFLIMLTGFAFFLNIGASYSRFLSYYIIFSFPFISFMLYEKCAKDTSFIKYLKIFILLMILFTSSFVATFPSEYTLKINHQNTKSELTGYHWAITNNEDCFPFATITITPYRLNSILYSEHCNEIINSQIKNIPPFHFGYNESGSLSNHFAETTLMLITERDRALYSIVFKEISHIRFTDSDFDRLNLDEGVDKIYCNGLLNVWKIT